jgi:hypothetical protein
MSPEELNRLRADGALLRSIIGRRVKLRKAGHQWKGCCPFHNENTASFIVYSDAVAHYHCFGCSAHGTVFDFVMATEHVDFTEAARRAAAEAGMAESNTRKSSNGEQEGDIWEPMVPPPAGAPKPDATQLRCDMLHEYCSVDDQILYYIRRVEAKDGKPKQFYPLTYGVLNGRTGWHSRAPSEPRALYGLNRLSHAPPDATVILCEGEKAADAAQRMFPNIVVMTWPGGAKADCKADFNVIANYSVILWPDADEPGRAVMSRIAQRLSHVQILDTTDLPDGFDAADLEHDDVDDADAWLTARLHRPDRTVDHQLPEIGAANGASPLSGDGDIADGDVGDRLADNSQVGGDQGGGHQAGDNGARGELPVDDEQSDGCRSEQQARAPSEQLREDTTIDVLVEIAMLGPNLTLTKLIRMFNRKYAVANEGGKAVVIWAIHDPLLKRDRHERASFVDFERFYQNHKLSVIVKNGKTKTLVTKSFGTWWLDNPRRRQYLGGVVFDPAYRTSPGTLNLWRGWTVTPKPGDWSLMRDHIKHVICGGRIEIYNYVIRWLAHMVQKPHLAAEGAIVLRGLKGTGKGMLGKWLLRLCGQHGLHIVNASHLTGRFSGHLRDAIFIFADEAFFAGDKQHEGVLKAIITEGSLLIEAKYRTPVMAANMLHLLLASNSTWVIPASHDERRYLMLDVAADKKGDTTYFGRLDRQMEHGGLAAMLHNLLSMDLGDFHPRAVPGTAELSEQKIHSLDSLHRWWLAVLDRGFVWRSRYGHEDFLTWGTFVSTELLNQSYRQWCNDNRVSYPEHREALGKFMAKFYRPTRPNGAYPVFEAESVEREHPEPVVKMNRPRGFLVDDLDTARCAFSTVLGFPAGTFAWDHATDEGGTGQFARGP